MTYEFNDEEAESVWLFGNYIMIASLIMALATIIGLLTFLPKYADLTFPDVVMILNFLFLIPIAIYLFRPSDNFKRIATTEGKDIPELMQGIEEFNYGFLITSILIALIGILNFILIFVKAGGN